MNGTALAALAEYAERLDYQAIPASVVLQGKRLLLDTLGCATFGFDGDASQAARAMIAELAAPGLSTVIGDGRRTQPMLAAVANGVAIRYTEYNDTFLGKAGPIHPSEIVPAALAVGEYAGASGEQVLAAIVLGYELNGRIADSVRLIESGWHHTTMGILVVPAVAGKLLGFDRAALEQALAISASYGFTTDAMHRGELSMMRNLAYPLTAYTGILAALLARHGFTGPDTALDGAAGFFEQVGADTASLVTALADHGRFLTNRVLVKEFACSTISQAPVSAALRLARENGLGPDGIAAIRVRTFRRAWEVGGDPERRHPDNKESADHSMYYAIAVGLLDGDVGPAQFTPERISSPDVHRLIDRIAIEWLPELDPLWPSSRPAIVEVTGRDGQTHTLRVDSPPGDPENPMTDEQLQGKFQRLVRRRLQTAQADQVVEAVMGLDRAPDLSGLMDLLRFAGSS